MASKKEFVEHKQEGIWQYFLKEKKGQSAQCKKCNAELKTTGGSTKGLHEHMKRLHGITLLKREADNDNTNDIVDTSTQPPRQKAQAGLGPMDRFLIDRVNKQCQRSLHE